MLLAGGKRHVDTRLGIEHIARDTSCELTWRGLGTGRGRAVFHGGILIREGADGSDAMLSNKNLLLSEDAEIDTQPVLEIHADEVKAAHGATVGQLDANALFYLRSRGLPEAQAQQLLTAAFCREPLSVLEDERITASLLAGLDGSTPWLKPALILSGALVDLVLGLWLWLRPGRTVYRLALAVMLLMTGVPPPSTRLCGCTRWGR